MSHQLQLVKTADGSNTIYSPEVGENYHSKHGALQESKHVFLNSGLVCFLDRRITQASTPNGRRDLGIDRLEVSPSGGDLEGANNERLHKNRRVEDN